MPLLFYRKKRKGRKGGKFNRKNPIEKRLLKERDEIKKRMRYHYKGKYHARHAKGGEEQVHGSALHARFGPAAV
jgi:hypothetical protein